MPLNFFFVKSSPPSMSKTTIRSITAKKLVPRPNIESSDDTKLILKENIIIYVLKLAGTCIELFYIYMHVFISRQLTSLAGDRTRIKPKRHHKSTTNPIKNLQQRNDVRTDTEVNLLSLKWSAVLYNLLAHEHLCCTSLKLILFPLWRLTSST